MFNGKWNNFSKWIRQNNKVDALKATIPMIAEFLNMLFEVWELEISTIQRYRAAISRVIKLAERRDLSEDPYLNALISNFSIERPFQRKTYSSWDLLKVLKSLMEKPYEPLTTTSLANITRKTVFLLLLASGLRRNELHAIDVNKTVYYKDNHILLYPNDKFIAKNMNTKTGEGDFKGIELKLLTYFVGPDLTKDALLCPVRCVKNYIKRQKIGGVL